MTSFASPPDRVYCLPVLPARRESVFTVSFAEASWFINSCFKYSHYEEVVTQKARIASLEDHVVFYFLYGYPEGFLRQAMLKLSKKKGAIRYVKRWLADFGEKLPHEFIWPGA